MICFFYRWRISSALDSNAADARLPHRHMERCPACRDFYQSCLTLGHMLRDEAVPTGVVQPRAIAPTTPARPWNSIALAGALAACLLLAAGVLFVISRPTPDGSAPIVNNDDTPQAAAPGVALSSAELLTHIRHDVAALAMPAGQPILREIERTQHQLSLLGRNMISPLPGRWLNARVKQDANRGDEVDPSKG